MCTIRCQPKCEREIRCCSGWLFGSCPVYNYPTQAIPTFLSNSIHRCCTCGRFSTTWNTSYWYSCAWPLGCSQDCSFLSTWQIYMLHKRTLLYLRCQSRTIRLSLIIVKRHNMEKPLKMGWRAPWQGVVCSVGSMTFPQTVSISTSNPHREEEEMEGIASRRARIRAWLAYYWKEAILFSIVGLIAATITVLVLWYFFPIPESK